MDIWTVWFLFSIVVAIGAAARGRSGIGWFVLSLLISPLLGLILLLLLPSLGAQPDGGHTPMPSTHVRCPDCAELVLNEARKCKHCGCRLVPLSEQSRRIVSGPS
jgi:hypothetical protein